MKKSILLLSLFVSISSAYAGDSGIGIGPIKEVKLSPTIDQKMADLGKATFKKKCSECHRIEKQYTAPQLLAITKRRRPEWIMNMILNPTEMEKKDAIAMSLHQQLLKDMTNQHLPEATARVILEFFRDNDKNLTPDQIKKVKDLYSK